MANEKKFLNSDFVRDALIIVANDKTLCEDYEYYEKLIDLIGFEDVNEIILKHQDTFGRFLTDRWVSVKDNYYFEITGEGKAYYNLPHDTSGKYYTLSNGIYSIGDYIAPNDSNGKTFKFTVISENRIKVYCFKNKSTYELYREGSEDLNRAMLVASVLS